MSDDRAYLWDGTHVLVAGVTGANTAVDAGGKSVTTNWWAQELYDRGHVDWGIAFAPKGPGVYFDGRDGAAHVSSVESAADAVADGADLLEWSPDARGDMAEQHDAMTRFAEGLDGGGVIVHDDAVMYADGDGLSWATALGGNPASGEGIKSLVVSQDVWDLPRKSVRANLNVLAWVGPVTDDARRYFDVMQMGWAADDVAAAHVEPFMWSVVVGNRVHTFEPVPEKFA